MINRDTNRDTKIDKQRYRTLPFETFDINCLHMIKDLMTGSLRWQLSHL